MQMDAYYTLQAVFPHFTENSRQRGCGICMMQRYDAMSAANTDSPTFVNNALLFDARCAVNIDSPIFVNNALRHLATSAANTDSPIFVNNAVHSLFSNCNIVANEVGISSANGYYAPKAFLETEFSTNKESKITWLNCQGYNYEEDLSDFTSLAFTSRE